MIAEHIKTAMQLPAFIVKSYLEDLQPHEMLVRPHEKMNHIIWQLGHLIASENFHIHQIAPDRMPTLPDGFRERYTKETARRDDPGQFHSKESLLTEMQIQRQGTLAVLSAMTDEQLTRPAPESINYLGPTIGAVFSGEANHWMMHAGQWAVVRRMLGRPPLF